MFYGYNEIEWKMSSETHTRFFRDMKGNETFIASNSAAVLMILKR